MDIPRTYPLANLDNAVGTRQHIKATRGTVVRGPWAERERPEHFAPKPMNVTLDKLPPAYPKELARPSWPKRFAAAVRTWFEQQWCPHWSIDVGAEKHDVCNACDKRFRK